MGIGRPRAWAAGGIGADDMVVGEYVMVAELLGGLGKVPDWTRVGADFSLREHYANFHALLLLTIVGESLLFSSV
jgi:hypothetical protein